MNLTDFQIAVTNEDANQVHNLLSELDLKSEGLCYQQAAEHFDFKLVEHRGKYYAMRSELASIFGYLDESGLRKLCQNYQIEGVKLGTFGHEVRMLIKEAFGLHPNDGKTVLLGWDGFLLAGAKGQNESARKVFAYLLQMERKGRIALMSAEAIKLQTQMINNGAKVINALAKIDKIQANPLKQQAIAQANQQMGVNIPLQTALELPLEQGS